MLGTGNIWKKKKKVNTITDLLHQASVMIFCFFKKKTKKQKSQKLTFDLRIRNKTNQAN